MSTVENNGRLVYDANTVDQAQTPSRRPEQTLALALSSVIKVLLALSFPWITLALSSFAWGFVLYALAFRVGVPHMPLIVAASIFTLMTHVPTWWKRG